MNRMQLLSALLLLVSVACGDRDDDPDCEINDSGLHEPICPDKCEDGCEYLD